MDKLVEGLIVTLLGMGATFAIMALLVLFINLVKYLIKIFDKKQPKSIKEQIIIENTEIDDKKVIAAVTAAVYCYMSREGKTESDFVVRKIRKVI